jgi:hypothetical protein
MFLIVLPTRTVLLDHPVVDSSQAKNHLSFAIGFFHIFEPNKGTKGPENYSLD